MNSKALQAGWLAAAVAAVLSCVTINVYFPEAEIKDLSRKIEAQVREGAEPAPTEQPKAPAEEPPPPGAAAPGSAGLGILLGATPAWAQTAAVPEPDTTNPAIRAIIESRRARVAAIDRFKGTGVIGENNRALLEVRSLDALPDLRDRAEVQRLMRAENADREQLFKEIAAAKSLDASQIPRIQETYAVTLREVARPGDWIQLPDGAWRQK